MGNGLGQTLFASQVVPVVGLGDLAVVEIEYGQIKVFQFAAAPEIVKLLAVVVVAGVEIVFVPNRRYLPSTSVLNDHWRVTRSLRPRKPSVTVPSARMLLR